MRKIIIVLCTLMVCIIIVAQSGAGEIYDLSGEWDAVYSAEFGGSKDIVKISQVGNQFVGVKLIGSVYIHKGEETIKGELIDEMINQVSARTYKEGKGGGVVWSDAQGVIIENGNKIIIQTYVNNYCVMTLTMTRKQ